MRSSVVPLVGAATAALGALGWAVKEAIDRADDMGKAAQKFGLPVEQLSRLDYAANLADVSLETLGVSLGKLSKNMDTASHGGKAAVAAFADVGIAFRNTDGTLRSSNDVLMDLADRFAAMPDGAEKTAEAMALLGKGGAAMIPLLNAGGAAIGDMGDEAQRAGQVISLDTARAAEEFNDNLTRLKANAQGLAQRLAGVLVPALADISGVVITLAQNFGRLHLVAAEVFERILLAAQGFGRGMAAVAANIPAAFVAAFQGVVHAAATAFEAVPGSIGEKIIAPLQAADAALAGIATEGTAEFNAGIYEAGVLISDAVRPLETLVPALDAAGGAARTAGAGFEAAADGGGGGGGAKKLSEALDELKSKAEAVFSETRTPQENFIAQMAELDQMVGAGLINMDTFQRGVKQAKDELADAGDTGSNAFRNMSDDAGDMVANVLQGTQSIGEGFRGMLDQIAGDLISSGIGDLLKGTFSGGGTAGGGGFFGGILKAIGIPGFARGTMNAPRGLALVGERGPELVRMRGGEQVIPNHMLGGGMAITVNVEGARGNAEIMSMVQAGVAHGLGAYDQTLPSRVGRISQDPRRR
jgi:hypothetical protein